MQLTRHFHTREFADANTGEVWNSAELKRLAMQLEVARAALGGHGIEVTGKGGCRTPETNAQTGGADESQHLQCRAADIRVRDGRGGYVPSPVVYAVLTQLMDGGHIAQGGLGLYDGFVHYDIRGQRTRWRGEAMRHVEVPAVELGRTAARFVARESGKGPDWFPVLVIAAGGYLLLRGES